MLAEVALRRAQPVQALAVIEEAGTARPEALVMRAQASLHAGAQGDGAARRRGGAARLAARRIVAAAKVALARIDIADGHPDKAQRTLTALERTSQKRADVAAALGEVFLASAQHRSRALVVQRGAAGAIRSTSAARLQLARLDHDAGKLDGGARGAAARSWRPTPPTRRRGASWR